MEGTYGFALSFYSWLKEKVLEQYPDKDYHSGRMFREKFQKLTSNLLVRLINHEADLKGAPKNPWMNVFYPEKDCFLISFADFLGMNGSYQWYLKGVKFPGLNYSVHPFFGVYFPTRFEHLILFDNWLEKHQGQFNETIDIGAGCGVLSFYLLKHGVNSIVATDINPNAIFSIREDLKKNKLEDKINAVEGSFFAGLKKQYDLIVFNPPWLPGEANSFIDKGIYYPDDFLESFFRQAEKHIKKEGRLVILFSNFAIAAGIINHHPLEILIKNLKTFTLVDVTRQKVTQGKEKKFKHWMNSVREKEWVELWEFKKS